ncbi:hypothetical protein ACFUEL_36610, partial [Kitasatospora sp. NPDC057198]
MAVELPEPLQWVLLLLAGTRWPEADEDQLRHMAEHCRKAAENVKDAAQSADSTIKRALDGQQGVAAEALAGYWEKKYTVGEGGPDKPGAFPGAVDSLNGMGDMLEQMANSAETAKIQIIAQLGILAFELATAEAEAPFTAGASLLQVPAMIAVSRTVVQQILKQLLKETLKMAAKQAAQMGAINFLAQGIELAEGHRKSIDMKEVGQNALGGAVGGASAHLIGKGIGAAGKKIGAENALNSTAGKIGTGAAIGVGADVSTQLITTGHVDSGSLLGSGLSGGAGAGLHAGASAIKSHGNVPKPVDAPKLDLPDTAGAGHDGPPTFTKPTSSSGDSTYRGPSGTTSGDSAGPAPTSGSTSASTSASTSGAGSGAGAAFGPGSTADAGSSSGHTSTTGAGEPKVNGLAPFGSDRSTGTTAGSTAGNTAGATTHETAAPAPHEQVDTRAQEPAVSRIDSRTAAPNTETEPAMVRSVHPTTGQPHETPAPQPHQESPTPRAESVAVQPHETPTPQVHESAAPRPEPVAQQPHETPAPHQEPAAAQVHESPAPHHEPAAAQPHEAPAPQLHETSTVQPHETPAPHHESATQQPHEAPTPQPHENAAPRHEPAAAQSHPSPAPHQEGPAPLDGNVASRVVEQPAGATAAQSSAVPNLSGVLGGAGHLAGGGGTHLDGGTRSASAPAPVRPAGPEQVPGQVV